MGQYETVACQGKERFAGAGQAKKVVRTQLKPSIICAPWTGESSGGATPCSSRS